MAARLDMTTAKIRSCIWLRIDDLDPGNGA
jgi:hypothetical protein